LFVFGCNKNEPDKYTIDFVKFSINDFERTYEFKDSVFKYCEPARFDPTLFEFIVAKTYSSSDSEFHSLTINIEKFIKKCPTDNLENDCNIVFNLARKEANNKFIDYLTYRMDNIDWIQKYHQGNIVITGNFSGWLYKFYPYRWTDGFLIEPTKTDSIYMSSGKFQFTL
jgi:hypothetical protein